MPTRLLPSRMWGRWAMGEFLLALLLLLTGPAVAFEVPEGFRGIKWGTTIAEVGAQFTLIEDSTRGTKYYARKDDRLKIGEADVIRILYAFYRDRFFYVSVRFANLANFRPIKETLFAAYGPGNRPNQYRVFVKSCG